jgi:hypothetical protein
MEAPKTRKDKQEATLMLKISSFESSGERNLPIIYTKLIFSEYTYSLVS